MAQFVIKELDDNVLSQITSMASAKGHSLEDEITQILTQTVNKKRKQREAFSARAAELRALAGPQKTDSAQLLREERDGV